MKKTLSGLILCMMICAEIWSVTSVLAADPAPTVGSINTKIQESTGTHVWDSYNQIGQEIKDDTNMQISSGVMTRDTILNYGVRMLVFMSQAGLLMGGLMFVYTGYGYIMSVITGGGEPKTEYITNAIYGILIIIFSYAIMRILTRAFLT